MKDLARVTPQATYAGRRDPVFGKYWRPPNHWLRMIYAALLRIKCLRDCAGERYAGDTVELTETAVALRETDTLSQSVYIYNAGDREAAVYEAGALLGFVAPAAGFTLPMPGYLALTAKATGTAAQSVAFSTAWVFGGGQTTITLAAPPSPTLAPGDNIRFGTSSVYSTHTVVLLAGTTLVVTGEATGAQVKIVYKELVAEVTAYTTRRCLCGDAPATYYDDAPVGSFLL